jgi:hypothetical protein
MSRPGVFYTSILIFLLLLVSMQGVSAWNVQNLAIKPASGPISPGTPVTATCTIHFDSWMAGLTFPSQHSLDMYTDLSNASWIVTKTEIGGDRPAEPAPFAEKSGVRVRVDGWSLSYASTTFELDVQLKGVAPDVGQAQDKIIIRVQERDSDGEPLTDTVFTRKYQVSVPTPTPAPSTPAPVPATTGTATSGTVPEQEITPAIPVTPAKKQTYTPGPEPVLVMGMVAGLFMILAAKKKN